MQSIEDADLLTVKLAKQTQKLQSLKPKLTNYPKYFFNPRQNNLILYDNSSLYLINRQQIKNFNLGKQYLISQLAYHFDKDIVVYLTAQEYLYAQFLTSKAVAIIKKQVKKPIIFDWVYGVNTFFQFFIADEKGIQLYKVQEEKKTFKEVKSLSGKYNSFLYQPLTQTLVGFPIGDCRQVHPFVFHNSKSSNWFRMNPISINFINDQLLIQKVNSEKSLGLEWGKNNKQIFSKNINFTHFSNLIRINKKCYLILFFAEEGLLKLFCMNDDKEKEVIQKLPCDSIPDFIVVDNMFTVHLKIQGITFIYDLNGNTLQPLVSPFPLRYKGQGQIKNVYEYCFFGERAIHPRGIIGKWQIQLNIIFNYLKNQQQIFDFLNKRKQAKMQILAWLRRDLFTIKELNLSKFWKSMFVKFLSNLYPQTEVINLLDLFSNLFYTLSQQQMIPKQKFMNIILQCVRQALQLKIFIPLQLQNLLFDLLMQFKKYETLVYLMHNNIIKDSNDLAQKVAYQYFKTHDMILGTLLVDITYRSGSYKNMFKILMKMERVRDAKRYVKQNYDKIEVLYLIEVAKYLKNQVIIQQYLKYIKSFILFKYPAINIAYLNEAEQKLKKNLNPTHSAKQEELSGQNAHLLSDF